MTSPYFPVKVTRWGRVTVAPFALIPDALKSARLIGASRPRKVQLQISDQISGFGAIDGIVLYGTA